MYYMKGDSIAPASRQYYVKEVMSNQYHAHACITPILPNGSVILCSTAMRVLAHLTVVNLKRYIYRARIPLRFCVIFAALSNYFSLSICCFAAHAVFLLCNVYFLFFSHSMLYMFINFCLLIYIL